MWNETGFKAVEQDKILHPTRPSCLTFSAAGRLAIIEPVNAEKVGTWLAFVSRRDEDSRESHNGGILSDRHHVLRLGRVFLLPNKHDPTTRICRHPLALLQNACVRLGLPNPLFARESRPLVRTRPYSDLHGTLSIL